MAISSYQVYLMRQTGPGPPAVFSKLVDIKDYPDLGGSPDMLETTTTSDPAQTFILGIQSVNPLEFTANYVQSDFTALKALNGTEETFAVWMGGTSAGVPNGSNGKFQFKGRLDVHVVGGGVNEVVDMLITIAPSTQVEKVAP